MSGRLRIGAEHKATFDHNGNVRIHPDQDNDKLKLADTILELTKDMRTDVKFNGPEHEFVVWEGCALPLYEAVKQYREEQQ